MNAELDKNPFPSGSARKLTITGAGKTKVTLVCKPRRVGENATLSRSSVPGDGTHDIKISGPNGRFTLIADVPGPDKKRLGFTIRT